MTAWLRVARVILPGGGQLIASGSAYVDSWGQDASDDTLNSVKVGGIGATSFGKELRVKIVSRDGKRVLDTLTWKIDAQVSPELDLQAPLAPSSIGAVLIAIE
ncbi:MAG: hypothetical protein IIA89_06545 [Chloroflexi bacterium]|nr:hypothetical protein [Chloroflexota bacterium]